MPARPRSHSRILTVAGLTIAGAALVATVGTVRANAGSDINKAHTASGVDAATNVSANVLVDAKTASPFNIQGDAGAELAIAQITLAPGADGGWHSHDGYVAVAVTKGTATFYDGDDQECRSRRLGPGEAIVESPGHVHITRNEGVEPLEFFATYFVNNGHESDISVAAPGNCPF